MMDYHKAKEEYAECRQVSEQWEQKYGNKREQEPKSIRTRLKQNEEMVKQRERNHTFNDKKERRVR